MAKKQRKQQSDSKGSKRVALDYDGLKVIFPWILTIGPAQKKATGTKCTMRLTFKHKGSRIREFADQKKKFEGYMKDFYSAVGNQAKVEWREDCAIVMVY